MGFLAIHILIPGPQNPGKQGCVLLLLETWRRSCTEAQLRYTQLYPSEMHNWTSFRECVGLTRRHQDKHLVSRKSFLVSLCHPYLLHGLLNLYLLLLCCGRGEGGRDTCHDTGVEVRRQSHDVIALLPPVRGLEGLNSGRPSHPACVSPTQPSCYWVFIFKQSTIVHFGLRSWNHFVFNVVLYVAGF